MSVAHINTGTAPGRAPAETMLEGRPGMHRVPTPAPGKGLLPLTAEALPGVARIGATTVAHTLGWGVAAYARTWGRMVKAVVDPAERAALSDDLSAATGAFTHLARSVAQGTPVSEALERWGVPALERTRSVLEARGSGPNVTDPVDKLRLAGEQLLRRSRDVWGDETRHPAYEGILRDLAPDEARILVLLLRDGPQPSVDVWRGGLIGRFETSRELARGLTMIGARASVRYPESVPRYLNNLTRLGLIWTSREPVADLLRYQVVEAQPDVLAAVHSVRRAAVIRRSVHLTPFGQDFARICFADADELALLPEHEAPPEAATEGVAEDRPEG